MKRRNLLKLAALTGVSLSLPFTRGPAFAASEGFEGPFFITINAGGGWDPRFMFDPILNVEQNRAYTEIGTIGNIDYAPIALPPAAPDVDYDNNAILLTNEQFLTKHGSNLLVLNGVDMETNNHDAGSRSIWSGKLQEGYPAIGALLAGEKAADQPMAYLSSGGFDSTEGVVPLTRVGSASTLRKIAYPNRQDPGNSENTTTYHSDKTWSRIQDLQMERLKRQIKGASLPRVKRSMKDLQLARENDDEL